MTAPFELPDAVLRKETPADDIVLAYVTHGALAKYVEGVAAKNPAFREELEGVIDGLHAAGESVSTQAAAWRRSGVVFLPQARKQRQVLPWLAVAAAVLVSFGGYAFVEDRRAKQDAARVEALREAEIAAKQAELERLTKELRAQQEAIASAAVELASARSEADRARAQAKLVAAQQEQRQTQQKDPVKPGTVGIPRKASTGCNCQPNDPLCACLP